MNRQTVILDTVCLVYKDLCATDSLRDDSVSGCPNIIIKFLNCFLGMDVLSARCAPRLRLIPIKLVSGASCCLLIVVRGVRPSPMVATRPLYRKGSHWEINS